jgi:hypothetical protein
MLRLAAMRGFHPWLAIVCFFRVLFGRELPAELVPAKQLPDPDKPKPKLEAVAIAPTLPVAALKDDKPKTSAAQHQRDGALALLALLQREGRLVDFLRESLDGHSDADIGAAARELHRGCKKVLDQHLAFEPVMPGAEDAPVSVPKGFDPAEVRLIGEAKGEAPYKGTLRHHGWRVTDAKLPALADGVDRTVIAPAEVEV